MKHIVLFVLFLLFSGSAQAEKVNLNHPGEKTIWKQGKLERLHSVIGTQNYDAVLNHREVSDALQKRLGK